MKQALSAVRCASFWRERMPTRSRDRRWRPTSRAEAREPSVYSCNEVMAELANYLDDQVAAEIRRELEIHLSQCRTCGDLRKALGKRSAIGS